MSNVMTLNESIAESLEAHPELLPYMPELLADLWSLGANPAQLVRLLSPLLDANARVLDLACGKGAVSATLAARLGCRVLGLDGMSAFIKEARARAKRLGVGRLCRFEVGDIRDYHPGSELFDAVILGATGSVWGSLREGMGRLRQMAKPGGFIVLDEAWRSASDDAVPESGAAHADREEIRAALTAYGDAIIAEEACPLATVRKENAQNNTRIRRRVESLVRRHPRMAAQFCAYASRQTHECYLLENVLTCAVWVIRVGDAARTPA